MTDEKRSRVLGMILGSVSRGQFPQREPVAFLYGHVAKEGETPTHTINGVWYVGAVCPDIFKVYTPELQAEYPFALLIKAVDSESYWVYASAERAYVTEGYTPRLNGPCARFYYYPEIYPDKTEWTEMTLGTEEWYTFGGWDDTILWANHDIPASVDTPSVSASQPIPVYE